jgi:hypothetical protein
MKISSVPLVDKSQDIPVVGQDGNEEDKKRQEDDSEMNDEEAIHSSEEEFSLLDVHIMKK